MTNEKDLVLKKDFAEIREVKLDDHNANVLRVYCLQFPDEFSFQIRTHKPITEFGTGKPRNMIATVSLSIKEVEAILEYMKKEAE